ncbi:hypothetical protein SNE40_013553 [Patella caerulea]|uniref:Uncharacterized protein n=1 Tax=Patella caerulea TaxID=87958 RepID=A0AAN8JG58_PATCE
MTQEIKSKILKYLNETYSAESDSESRALLDIATMLDPRYTDKYLIPSTQSVINETLVRLIASTRIKPPVVPITSSPYSDTAESMSQDDGSVV